jgi:type VI secretion system secreted protein VgrG
MDNAILSFERVDSGLTVRRFHVEEAMSSLFRVKVIAMSPDEEINLSEYVGRRAEFVLNGLIPRRFRGIVLEMELLRASTTSDSLATYEVTIVPSLWRATQRRNQRAFQHISIPDIVTRLLHEWHVEHTWKIDRAQYPKLELRTQYDETDYAFLSRLLEEAGIAFYFSDEGEGHGKLVLDDAPQSRELRKLPLPYFEHVDAALGRVGDHITNVKLREQSRPGKVTLRDYDPQRPRLQLFGGAASERHEEAAHEQYHHLPGSFLHELGGHRSPSNKATGSQALTAAPHRGVTPAHGAEHTAHHAAAGAQATSTETPVTDDLGVARFDAHAGAGLARRMLESIHTDRRLITFETSAHNLHPGVVFAIAGHPRADISIIKTLLVTRFVLEGEMATPDKWRFHGTAVFTDHPYRPAMTTPKPRIYGVQSAVVVGPSQTGKSGGGAVTGVVADAATAASKLPGAALAAGVTGEVAASMAHLVDNEIYVDEMGRVRVQFNWDREGLHDAHSSIWMRVSQGWAGGGYGLFTIPRVGHEVLIAFLDGDPDCPIVVGRVHNLMEPVPFKLPENKTVSTWKTASSPGGAGFNELRFDDAAGREHVYLQAQKDMDHLVNNNLKQGVGGDSTRYAQGADGVAVGADRTKFVNQSEVEVTGLHRSTLVGLNRVATVGGEDSTFVGSRWSVTIARGLTRRLTREIESAAQALGTTVRSAATTVMGLIPNNPLASAADAALADFGRASFDKLHGVLDLMKTFETDPGPPPTSIEVVDRQIKLSTGEASIILDGPNVTISAQGTVAIHAMDNISVFAEREVVVASREKAAVISATDDVIVQAGKHTQLNPYIAGGPMPQAISMKGPVGKSKPLPPGVCAGCGGERDGDHGPCITAREEVEKLEEHSVVYAKPSEPDPADEAARLWLSGLDPIEVIAILRQRAEEQEQDTDQEEEIG